MKKRTTAAALMLAFLLSACGSSAETANSAGSAVTESAEAVSSAAQAQESAEAERYDYPLAGMSIPVPETYLKNRDKLYLVSDGAKMEDGLYVLDQVLYPDTLENLMAITEEAEFEAVRAQAIPLLLVLKAEDEKWSEEEVKEWLSQASTLDTSQLQVLSRADGFTCYEISAKEYADDLPEEIKTLYDAIIQETAEAKQNIIHSEIADETTMSAGTVLEFTTTDIDGNTLSSSDLFAANKITMLNCWATWCGPCIREIPELEQINKRLREKGCEVIGVMMDGHESAAMTEGLDILATAGATYRNILPWDSFDTDLFLQAYPTTYFVNSEGEVIGEAVIGAYVDRYEEEVEKLLAEM
ncbi:MAG: TlpA family protein disulfide reductase [Lachnospiraceae bacterium]|nr:TlpA family protein disulfide reductase [Lachnospiraceae bacterium]